MGPVTVGFTLHWARRYEREHHPYGLDEEDVENHTQPLGRKRRLAQLRRFGGQNVYLW